MSTDCKTLEKSLDLKFNTYPVPLLSRVFYLHVTCEDILFGSEREPTMSGVHPPRMEPAGVRRLLQSADHSHVKEQPRM